MDLSATSVTLATHSLFAFKQRTPRKKMWQTQDERKLLLFMQLFQQWLQVAAATLRLEELEEQEKKRKTRQKEKGNKSKNETTENAMGQTVVDQKTNGQCASMRSSCMN